jgi:hypothetical protein
MSLIKGFPKIPNNLSFDESFFIEGAPENKRSQIKDKYFFS